MTVYTAPIVATTPVAQGAPIIGWAGNSPISHLVTLETPIVGWTGNSPMPIPIVVDDAPAADSPIVAAAKLLAEVDEHGNTQLHRCRDPELAEALLAVGIKVDILNFGGSTPLHFVCGHDLPDVARVLIEHGANTSARNKQDVSVLHGTCGAGNLEVATLLLEWGARVDPRDFEANTPLHWAARRGHTECVKLLIKHGAEVDAENVHGQTPYFVAMMAGAVMTAEALVIAGANVHRRDRAGHGPLDETRNPRIAAIGPAHAAIAALIIDWQDARDTE